MEKYKQEFIEFMVDCGVLKFGDFVTKSGRKTPFFVNTGFYRTGAQLRKLGEYYAKAINDTFGTDFDVLFGPAYKGIPLTVATSMAISEHFGADIKYCSNRKEVKDHGDKGILLGSPIADGDKVVIIEDVTTAGTSIEETLPIIKAQGDVDVLGLVVSVDRCERGKGEKSALTEIQEKYGFRTTAIVMLFYPAGYSKPVRVQGAFISDNEISDVVTFLKENEDVAVYDTEVTEKIENKLKSSTVSQERDEYFEAAARFVIEKDKASIGMLQRMFKIGFNRAARIMDQLSDAGVVGPEEGTKPRKILMSMEEFENYIEESI